MLMFSWLSTQTKPVSLAAQEEEEHFPRCFRHQTGPLAHAEAEPGQAADAQDEGPEEEEGGEDGRDAGDQSPADRPAGDQSPAARPGALTIKPLCVLLV